MIFARFIHSLTYPGPLFGLDSVGHKLSPQLSDALSFAFVTF
jgi:hypothetical protein